MSQKEDEYWLRELGKMGRREPVYEDNPYPLFDCYVDFNNPDAKPALTPRKND